MPKTSREEGCVALPSKFLFIFNENGPLFVDFKFYYAFMLAKQ